MNYYLNCYITKWCTLTPIGNQPIELYNLNFETRLFLKSGTYQCRNSHVNVFDMIGFQGLILSDASVIVVFECNKDDHNKRSPPPILLRTQHY